MAIIGFDLTSISSPNLVGSSKFIQRLLRQMSISQSTNRYIIYLQAHIDPATWGLKENRQFEFVKVPSFSNKVWRILYQQTFFYRLTKGCDIIYSFCTYIPLFGRMKRVVTLHDLLPFSFTKKHGFFRRSFIKLFTRLISRRACHIVTVSEYSKRDIVKYLHKSPKEVSVIYNFICEDEAVIRNKEGGESYTKPYLCTVSSLQPGKNLANLIRGFTIFHKKHPEYHLYLCGKKGWKYAELFDLVNEERMSDWIHFTGYLPDEELDKLYSGCEAVAYVSFFEGFGIPPLEGFWHGKPCVVSNCTSLPEVVGNAGCYIDPYNPVSISDGIEEVIINKNQYVSNISTQIEKFDPVRETEKFVSLLERISAC